MQEQMEEAHNAFEYAIAKGLLTANPAAPNWAGNYMYMGVWAKGKAFKNINTREYSYC